MSQSSKTRLPSSAGCIGSSPFSTEAKSGTKAFMEARRKGLLEPRLRGCEGCWGTSLPNCFGLQFLVANFRAACERCQHTPRKAMAAGGDISMIGQLLGCKDFRRRITLVRVECRDVMGSE